ncbi:unnamed protein product [Meloidogyne enterolobii]|uniref:Uncharacterized protein n=1 Tax=Meloidogyne enterolobii TaxID=390850 RepID=A0ACB1AZ29_MELEN
MKKLSKIRNSIELDVSLSPLHEQFEFPLSCLICKEDYDQDYFTEISKIFRQKKMKTERIGIGVCFNSDMKINEIEMEEHLIRELEEEFNELIFVYSDFDSASIELTEAKPEEIPEEIPKKVEAPEKRKRKVKKQVKKQKEEGEEMEELTVQTSQLDINKISRDKSPRGEKTFLLKSSRIYIVVLVVIVARSPIFLIRGHRLSFLNPIATKILNI